MNKDIYEIDILSNYKWKTLRHCRSMADACYTIKAVRSTRKCKLRVLENNNVVAFINDDDFSLFYFLQRYEHYDSIREMMADQKLLGRYNEFVNLEEGEEKWTIKKLK